MLEETFERTIRQLCEDILSEPRPEALPGKIIDHLQKTFPVQWSTLWLTEPTGIGGEKQLRLAAAGGDAKKLLEAENGGPAVYKFGEGLTGEIAQQRITVNIKEFHDFEKYRHARKYDHVMYPEARAEDKCRCVLGVPLLLKSIGESEASENQGWRVIGVLKLENVIVSRKHPEPYFTPRDVETVEGYAAVIAVALEKAQMRADSIRIGAGLLEVSSSLLAKLGEPPKLDEIVKQTAKVISAEACSLWLRSGFQLHLRAAYGYHGSKQEVPPYQLEMAAEDNGQTTPGTATQVVVEPAKYKGLGLTVYVAQTRKPLNLTTDKEVRNHFAWKGANDERMWGKPRGKACYSLIAIPLIDNETGDLKGVFKIENKQPTLYYLQSYFTKEDEQFLTILGNLISLTLIISERIERLRRLDKLVGDIRFLDDRDEALFFILTGLTHNDGLQYNRAMIFLADEEDPTKLVCRYAVGHIELAQWEAEVAPTKDEELHLDLDKLLKEFRNDKQKFLNTRIMELWNGRKVDISAGDTNVIGRHAAETEPSTWKCQSENLREADMLHGFAHGDFVLIPITFERRLKGIIYADNCFTGNRVNRFECSILDLFAGMAGAIIQALGVPKKLQEALDLAWRQFSRPVAHQVGTEATIIDGEIVLYIKPELDQAPAVAEGRLAVRGKVMENALGTIQEAVKRLRLTAKDYQKLTAEPEVPEIFDLCELIDQTIKSTTDNFKGIKVVPQYREQPIWIKATPDGIKYVFEELLINAWKELHSDEGDGIASERSEMKICIEVGCEQDSVICTVSDNGPGIPQMLIPTLIQKPGGGRRGAWRGTGLGLYTCGQVLRQNRGTIEVLTKGKPAGYDGACFRITLPLEGLRRSQEVLVVEDNPVLRSQLKQFLAEHGFSISLAQRERGGEAGVDSFSFAHDHRRH